MSIQDVQIKKEYRSLLDNIAKDFYIPLLANAVSYKRAVGFFSSSILVEISKGIHSLVQNGGHISLIASPYLSDEDLVAISNGYKRREEIILDSLNKCLRPASNSYQADKLNLLANLIADGHLDIRIAITDTGNKIGMYHEKVGIIEDAEGNKVAFSGSANESANALLQNYETIDVYTSWSEDFDRVSTKESYFDAIWHNYAAGVQTIEFPELNEEIIRKYKSTDIDYITYKNENDVIDDVGKNFDFFKIPEKFEFFDYQKEAINNWMQKGCCGIFDMATGTGKTYTALGSLTRLSQALDENLAVIIVAPYQHLVEQWVEDILKFNVRPIVAYSYPGQNWRQQFSDAVSAYNVKAINHFCIITTNATFSGEDFQSILNKFKRNFCFVVDEAHNFGAKKLGSLLPKKARFRLALSATIERHRDEEGTNLLKSYFGKTPCISFPLSEAIQKGFLTKYYYYPVLVYLNEDEREKYNEYTQKIAKLGGASKENCEKNKYVERLLIERSRIIAGCHAKVDKLIEIIEPYKDDNYILVYCGATKYDLNLDDGADIKQIEIVTQKLYTTHGMKVHKFTSEENKEERATIKEMFQDGKSLQVITAIKCLDEGVNIPAIKKAFILASSTNPKEYIQRRGRVLRKFPGKDHADIFDFITLPRPLDDVSLCSPQDIAYDLSLVKKEFVRMLDFAATSRNPASINELRDSILSTYKQEFITEDAYND